MFSVYHTIQILYLYEYVATRRSNDAQINSLLPIMREAIERSTNRYLFDAKILTNTQKHDNLANGLKD